MSYQVALSFEDGVTRFITCGDDQTVADASYRQRINIPLDCRDGACGTCKAFCESGTYDGGDYIADALSPDEAAAGYVLPCSMKPRSDLVLRIASTSAVAKTRAATFTGTLTELDRLSPTTVAVTVETPQRDQLAFLPGQYVNVTVPGTGQSRSYSFSNAPDDERLTFLVKLTPGGVMSDYLTDRAAVGDELTFTGPNGSFFLRDTDQPLLLLAGGTGLAPILSILRALRASGSTRPAHLLYGATTDDDVVELDTLRELARQLPRLTWDYCVADPGSSAPNKGFVTSLIGDEHLHGGDVEVYLCGPPPMVEAVRKHFADLGVQPAGFHYEKFASSSASSSASSNASAASDPAGVTTAEAAAAEVVEAEVEPAEPETRPAAQAVTSPGDRVEPEPVPDPEPATPALAVGEGRDLAGRPVFPTADIRPPRGGSRTDPAAESAALRAVAGQVIWSGDGKGDGTGGRGLDPGDTPHATGTARAIAGQEMLPPLDGLAPLTAPPAAPPTTDSATRRPRFVSPGRFDGKVVVVTGAAQGIGEHTARRIAAEGGTLVLADRSDLVTELTDELTREGTETTAVTADLETWDGARKVVEAALTRFGRIDVLINNVGGAIWFKPFTEFTQAEIQAEINRSLMTTLWCCRAALPSMVERGGGVVVNVSSAATRGVHRIPYSAAKGGINAITASLAFEYADAGIRVVATAPGGTEAPPRRVSRGGSALETEQERAWFQAHIDQTIGSSLLKRYGTLDEQAAAITFLASDEASYITGTVLPVAGGDLG
ncbi:benzoate 1,2-dioxygenase electron transfer component BenC [Saccharomonospora cyanea]|uniref:2-polyprenylphenol hydroxylase-like oxidoreductase n=1 Tax=Saccharomonospora cyanea NA-134 TaxID=882082 RepID=H5XHA0_9PSEU|nr:benzoate 1,2-dioxygenase electron transfer component BenC [Saccharomonospora cyanea]EHR60585.1 2-polyprenylphenol hydroxylase-like oxidoreductase [Saccharomonospora cyanea NA-134]